MNEIAKRNPIGYVNKKSWFLSLRLVTTLLLLASGIAFLKPGSFNYTLLTLYGAFGLIYMVYSIMARSYSEEFVGSIVILYLACELLVAGLLVNQVGGNFSPFILFFIITIVSSAVYFRLLGSIILATIAGLLYALPVFFDLSFIYSDLIEPPKLAGMGISSDEAFYTVFLHLCLFYFFAFISGYLAENLFSTSRELQNIRFETREILEQMRSGLLTVNASGRIVYFNRAAGLILGIEPERVRGKGINDVFDTGLKEFLGHINDTLRSGRGEARSGLNVDHPEKGIIPIGLSSSVIRDDRRKLLGVIALFQDLTEAKRLDERMRKSDQMAAIGRLAAGIAHEIRNPLASISGSVEVLKDELKLEGDNHRLLQLILKESSRLNTILSDFLNFARMNKPPSGKCDLAMVIREVIELSTGHEQVDDSVEISCKIHRPVIMVAGGEDQIKQVLWNLIINSAQAMEQTGGNIWISTEDYSGDDSVETIKLTVADSGPGIPDDIKNRIFDPFFSTKKNGTGLGLPIVARIVDSLGGRIELESSTDSGTEFSIFLPREVISEAQPEVLHEFTVC